MKRRILIDVRDPAPAEAWVLVPRPADLWGQRLADIAFDGVRESRTLPGRNTRCEAIALRPEPGARVRIAFTFDLGDFDAPAWVWAGQDNAHTRPSPGLEAEARRLVAGAATERDALRRLVADTVEHFGYGHVDARFNDGCAEVPLVCGLATGSCVDINTYLLASARAVGLTGQYVAGYWFHPEKTATADMHCWLAFAPDGALEFWDVAHGLKWADTLGARVEAGLNPAGGRRVAMSCGRGLAFDSPLGPVEISHFSEPFWLTPDGRQSRPDLGIAVEDLDDAPHSDLPDPDARRQAPRPHAGAAQ